MNQVLEQEVVALLIVFIMAVILHHVIAKTGGILHSIATIGDSQYAVFTFRDDINLPMSKNILVNIFIPNVAMVLLYWLAMRMGWQHVSKKMWLFVGFYYLYRMFLICVLLHRKELYNKRYESCMFFVAIAVAYPVWKYFLISGIDLFPPISEIRNEIWLAIFLLIYKFVEIFLEQVVHQRDIVTDQMMMKYIAKQFDKFYAKYSECVEINYENRLLCILLYAIMIFENFNRVRVVRWVERLKILMGKNATTGIMQVKSSKYLSDKESIGLAYAKLKKEIVGEGNIISDEQIQCYALQYNHSEDYAKSVHFIYCQLKKYLRNTGKYKRTFFLDEEDITEQEVCGEYNLEQECEERSGWLTLGDVKLMTGLRKKEILAIQRKKGAIILFSEDEIKENFKEWLR